MSTSTWIFTCRLGLGQSDCMKYTPDQSARGAGKWGGCPSCFYRRAASAETQQAEEAHWQHIHQEVQHA